MIFKIFKIEFVQAPILALSAYAKMSPIQSPGRFLHLTPTGVQANSLASYVS